MRFAIGLLAVGVVSLIGKAQPPNCRTPFREIAPRLDVPFRHVTILGSPVGKKTLLIKRLDPERSD